MRAFTLLFATIWSMSLFAQVVQKKIVNNGGTGPYKAMAAQESSLASCTVYRPQDLAAAVKSGVKLPIVVFANGACVNSSLEYERMLTEVASYGYVIVAGGPLQMQSGDRTATGTDASLLTESLDWIVKQAGISTSEYYNRVDITKIAASGHSCGGAQVIAVAKNPAIKNYILFNSGMGNMSMGGASPSDLQNLHGPIIYIVGGESDVAYANAKIDYSRITNVEATLANLIKGGHSGTFWEPYGGSDSKMMVKWLDWHFKNASANCKLFLGNDLSEFAGWEVFSKNYSYDCSANVAITAPLSNATYTAPASIDLAATATVSTGTIAKLTFRNGTTIIGEDAASPYTFAWTGVAAGSYTITAEATDNTGKVITSTPVAIKVNPAQAAYNGTPWPIPGKIEFENYDIGGNGSAYLDNAAENTGGASFRTDEDVDIEVCKDADAGYNIGFATAGEWLEYTVNVATAGEYDITISAACANDGRTVSLSVNDAVVAKDIAIPNTGGWQTWEKLTVPKTSLRAGKQVIRVTIGALDYVNLNYMTFAAQAQDLPSISLRAGWNLIGYPFDGSANIDQALASIWDNVLAAKTNNLLYDKTAAPALNTLKTLEWGEGYWVKVSKNCELDWSAK